MTVRRALSLEPRSFGEGCRGSCRRHVLGLRADRPARLRCPVPDLVVSGVNAGGNMGADVTYSGTVGAAFEAALRGHPAVAFSVEELEPGWLDEAAPVLRAMVGHVVDRGLPRHTLVNVNLPDRPLAVHRHPSRAAGGASAYDFVTLAGDDGAAPAEHYLPCDQPASGERVETTSTSSPPGRWR